MNGGFEMDSLKDFLNNFLNALKTLFLGKSSSSQAFLVIIIVFVLMIVLRLVFGFAAFKDELTYLNREIESSTGAEQIYWIRERRRLWLSLLPFVNY